MKDHSIRKGESHGTSGPWIKACSFLLKPGNLEVAIKLCHRLFSQSRPVHYNQDIGEHLRFEGPLIICHHVTSRGHCEDFVHAYLVESSVALGLDFSNPLISKYAKDYTGQK